MPCQWLSRLQKAIKMAENGETVPIIDEAGCKTAFNNTDYGTKHPVATIEIEKLPVETTKRSRPSKKKKAEKENIPAARATARPGRHR
jgi:hypothetical protein